MKPVPLLAMFPGDAVIDDVDLSGENSRIAAATMVGGLVGAISGKLIKNCDGAAIVALTGSNDIFAQCAGVLIGGITGGGFYVAQCAQYYPAPLSVEILQCTAENVTVYGGRVTGTIAGYLSENSVVSSYTGEMTHSGAAEES